MNNETWIEADALEKFQRLKETIGSIIGANEATTRLSAIDTILFDILGWDKLRVETEKYSREAGFADYLFDPNESKALVLEVKREGAAFHLGTKPYPDKPVPFNLLARGCSLAADAMRQASCYATSFGSRYVAISNGHQWIFGLSFVEGESIENRNVIVFESLHAIEQRFGLFFNCFSPMLLYCPLVGQLHRSHHDPAPAKLSTRIIGYPIPRSGSKTRNLLRAPLQLVWDEINQNEDDREFLLNCYIAPKGTETGLSIAYELIEQHCRNDDRITRKGLPSESVEAMITSSSVPEKPILVLGRFGHGKSVFLRHLRRIRASKVLQKYIQIDIDFQDRPEKPADIPDFLFCEIESQLLRNYEIDPFEDSFVREVLSLQLKRFRKSVQGTAAEHKGEAAIAEAEGDLLHQLLIDRHMYYREMFRYLRLGRGYSIAIFFNNLDRRSDEHKVDAARCASAATRDWSALVFVCLRPSTFQTSRIEEALESIASKIIVVPSPKAAIMLRKRFDFAKTLADGSSSRSNDLRAGLSEEVAAKLLDAAVVFDCFAYSVRKNAAIGALFQGYANGDNRLLLQAVRTVLSSDNLVTPNILNNYENNDHTLSLHEVTRALIFDDSLHFDPNKCKFVNLFDIKRDNQRDHFIKMIVIEYMNRHLERPQRQGFCSVDEIVRHLWAAGYAQEQTMEALRFLFECEYCEGTSLDTSWENAGDLLRLRERGRYHITHLVKSFVYLDAVVVDTPICDPYFSKRIKDVDPIRFRLRRAVQFLSYLNSSAELVQATEFSALWRDIYWAIANDIEDLRR